MKKLFSLFAAVLMLAAAFCLLPVSALAAEVTGECGEGVVYSYDTDTHVLTVSYTGEGSGAMTDYTMRKSPFYTTTAIRNNCTMIVVGEGVTRIGNYAMFFLGAVSEVQLPSTIVSIGDYAFGTMNALTTVNLPEGLESIGMQAFGNDRLLTGIDLPSTLTYIGARAFNGCSALTHVEIPGGVTEVGESAFNGCMNVTSLTIGEGVQVIGPLAFGSMSITSVVIPASVTSFNYDSFGGCPIPAFVVDENNTVYANSADGVIYSKDFTTLWRCPFGFEGEHVIDSRCKTVADYAFESCFGLTAVTIPEGVESLGFNAFAYASLTSVTVPESVTELGSQTFYGCDHITEAHLLCNVEQPSDFMFYGCTALTEMDLGAHITELSDGFVSYCTSLVHFDVPETATRIPRNCFSYCENLAEIVLPDTVTVIEDSAFESCSSLPYINIPPQIERICMYAFRFCTSLQMELVLPESCWNVGSMAFQNCAGITSLTVYGDLHNEGYNPAVGSGAFQGCGFVTAEFFGSVETLDQRAFNNCASLISIVFHGDVDKLMNNAFNGCSSLETVVFEGAVNEIRNTVFNGCESLVSITFSGDVPSVNGSKPIGVNNPDLIIYYYSAYPDWQDMPLGDYTYICMDSMPYIEMIYAELRERPVEDNKHDLRFVAVVVPAEGCEIVRRGIILTNEKTGKTVDVEGKNIFFMSDEGYYFFTAVLKGVRPEWNNVTIAAQGYLVVEGAYEGVIESNVIEASVNDLLN